MKEAQQLLNQQKDLLKACNQDISQKVAQRKQLHKDQNEAQLKIRELEHKQEKHNKDTREAARQVRHNITKIPRKLPDRYVIT